MCVYVRSRGNASFPAPSTKRDYNTHTKRPKTTVKYMVEGPLESELGLRQKWTHCDL